MRKGSAKQLETALNEEKLQLVLLSQALGSTRRTSKEELRNKLAKFLGQERRNIFWSI
jgi:hypothetical protein